ncbi:MAG: hypothetical protein IKP54_02640 [Bacteroidales bacterium]|nr:hypothetical protein [Bacteroidales bacterium]
MNETTLDPKTMSWDDIKQVLADTSLKMQENERLIKELRENGKEIDRRMEESDRKLKDRIDKLTTRFTSQSGHILEGLMEPSAMKMFQDKGYDIDRCWKNFSKYDKSMGKKLEVDLLLLDDEVAIIVEVKINCTRRHIDHFIKQMAYFKKVCPEYADKEIMLAIAAVNYDKSAAEYAHKQGLFVIRVFNDNIFALDSNDGDKMKIL